MGAQQLPWLPRENPSCKTQKSPSARPLCAQSPQPPAQNPRFRLPDQLLKTRGESFAQLVTSRKNNQRRHSNRAAADSFLSTSEKIVDQPGQATSKSFDVFIYGGADGIRQEVERSLKRLQTDVIDLYQTHWQNDSVPIEEKAGVLEALKKEGKIRAICVSNASSQQINMYRHFADVDPDQEQYSMLDRQMEKTNLPKCADEHIAFLAYSPLSQGLLTGKVDPNRKYPEDDQRRYKPRFKPENVRKVQSMLEMMQPIARRHKLSLSQLVIAWTLAQRGCSHVLCGARNPQQAVDNAGAGFVNFNEAELAGITTAVDSYDGV
jgi:methylglyoxal reductase